MVNHLPPNSQTVWRYLVLLLLPVCILPFRAVAQDLPPQFRTFEPYAKNPVFESAPGEWDSLIRERGWIMKDGNQQYRMWYTGYDPDQDPVTMKLGYATSPNGIEWTRHSENPIYDDAWIEDMMVIRHQGTFYMFAEGHRDQPQLLTSRDGVTWQNQGTLDVRLTSGEKIPPGPYGTPTAWFEGGTWYLFYERRDAGIWLATSADLRLWTNVSDDPLIIPGPDDYDRLLIAMNQIVKHDGRYYAVMHGTGSAKKPRAWCTWFAVSEDLKNWEKCEAGPVLPVEGNKSSGLLIHDGNRFRLYTMHAKVDLHFAKSP